MQVVSSICRNPVLPVSAAVSFKPARARRHAGFVEIAFSIRNTGKFEAVRPFICFPVAVMDFAPFPDWVRSFFDSDSGRRMIRFMPKSGHSLEPGAIAQPCTVRLPFSRSGGGLLTIARTVERPLSGLPDLRLFAITGAGNFAPERSSIPVPAFEIRAAIRRGWHAIDPHAELASAG